MKIAVAASVPLFATACSSTHSTTPPAVETPQNIAQAAPNAKGVDVVVPGAAATTPPSKTKSKLPKPLPTEPQPLPDLEEPEEPTTLPEKKKGGVSL